MHRRTPGTALRRASGMGSPHSSQSARPGPVPRRLRARSIASFTVASILSCTAPSPAQPVAIAVLHGLAVPLLSGPAAARARARRHGASHLSCFPAAVMGRTTTRSCAPRHRPARLAAAAFALALACLGGPAMASDLLRLESHGPDQGLPQSTVHALATDDQGFLWVATQDGLARFDGHRF